MNLALFQTSEMKNQLENIIQKCCQKDRLAQKELYEYTYKKLLNSTLRYSANLDEGQWLFNMAMLKIFNNIENYQPNTNYLAWARNIIVKTSIDSFRKNLTHQQLIAPVEIQDYHGNDQVLNEALNNLESEKIIKLIRLLPENERLVFLMYEIEGYTHVDIEKETGIKKNTSKWLLAKSKKSLREQLSSLYNIKSYINE